MSKKLKTIQSNFSQLEKKLKRVTEPIDVTIRVNDKASPILNKMSMTEIDEKIITLSANDQVTKKIEKINETINRAMKHYETVLTVIDEVTGTAKQVINTVGKMMDRGKQIVLSIEDRVTKGAGWIKQKLMSLKDVNIRAILEDTASKSLERLKRGFDQMKSVVIQMKGNALERIERLKNSTIALKNKTIQITSIFLDRTTTPLQKLKKIYGEVREMVIYAKDRASKVIQNIRSKAADLGRKAFQLTVRVKDNLGSAVRRIQGTLSNLSENPLIKQGILIPMQLAANERSNEQVFTRLLGNSKLAADRLEALDKMSFSTPFSSSELKKSNAILQNYGGNVLATGENFKMVGNVAAAAKLPFEEMASIFGSMYSDLGEGRSIEATVDQLVSMQAITADAGKEMKLLASSGEDISVLWPKITQNFSQYEGEMKKASLTSSSLTKNLRELFDQKIVKPWGEALLKAFQPLIDKFNEFKNKYSYVFDDLWKHVQKIGQNIADSLAKPAMAAFNFLSEQLKILFPGEISEEMKIKMQKDPKMKKEFDELDQYRNMDFKSRISLVLDNAKGELGKWWNKNGKPLMEDLGEKAGKVFNTVLDSVLGDEDNPGLIDKAVKAAGNFVDSFIDSIDILDIGGRILKKFAEINLGGLKSIFGKIIGDKELENQGSVWGAIIANAFAIAIIAGISKKLKGLGGIVQKLLKLTGVELPAIGGKGKKDRTNRQTQGQTKVSGRNQSISAKEKRPNRNHTQPNESRVQRKGKRRGMLSKGKDFLGGLGKEGGILQKGLAGAKKVGKRIPILGSLLSASNLIGMNKKNAGEKVGSAGGGIAGGMAGAAVGAAIGSVVPVVGTAAGGLIGGIFGSMGGESFGEMIGKWFDGGGFEKIGQKAIEIKDQIVEVWSTVVAWFIENVWTPLSSTVVTVATTIWSSLVNAWTWIQETFSAVAGWFIENVWTPLSGTVVTVATGIWTALSNAWKTIQSIFGVVSSWFMDNVWNPLVDTVGTIKDSIGKKFEEAYKVVTGIWDGLSKWFEDNIQKPIGKVAQAISEGFSTAFGWVKKIFDKAGGIVDVVINWIVGKKKPDTNATGGYITQPTLSWVGEAGNEFVIPTQNNRGRGKMLLAQAASHLGMSVVPSGGAGNQVASSSAPTTSPSSVGSIGGSVSMNGNIQASSIGEQFNNDFERGLNHKVTSLDQWKQKNIQQPFGQLTSESGKYGQQTVAAFANGQQMTPTGTDSFLQSRVKAPYQQVMTASPTWGSGTVSGFATGQNATSVGTSQYVDQHIKQPFLQTKQESPGWGSGMIDAFNRGMGSKASEVTQAAKEMAKKVEQAFRDELDIHSPSRVMMSLGKFASIGVVKGLDSVDVKKFAENQAGSLIGAFSGMGASGLSVQQWLMAALMATGTSMSWLPGLMTIAQHESNGNPRAINLWDSNAKKGTPSKGLMQTIGPTFNSNKGKGMNDIWNPIHNAVAAINYIKGRYGTVFNTPGLRSMRRGGSYKGYANGGLITQEQVARVGEGNKREWIIPEERGIRGRYLLTQAAKALGMQVYDPTSASAPLPESQMQQVTSAQSTGTTTSSGNKQITIQFNGDQHFHNEQDQQSLVEKIRQMLVDELEIELHTGTKGVVIDG